MEGIEEARRRVRRCLETGKMKLNLTDLDIKDLNLIPELKECKHITHLSLNNNQISNISPLSGLNSLKVVNLDGNQIVDLSPLSGLISLTKLELSHNQIFDLSPLSGLSALTWLLLDGNQIVDLNPLSGLSSLTELSLCNSFLKPFKNRIVDVSPLANLISLTRLRLGNNQIADLSPLSGLISLRILELSDNQVSDVNPLSGLISLTELELNLNQVSDISPLSGLISLTKLVLWGNQIFEISPLSNLISLTYLELRSNHIIDVSPLSNLISLTRLSLGGNQIIDVSPLSGLISLTWLSLDGNQISEVSPLSGLISLSILELSDNQISDVSPLSDLISLSELVLRGNQIVDVSPLSDLISLTRFSLRGNKIADVSPLSGLISLRELELIDNQISDVDPLSGLISLTGLYLTTNRIVDLRPLSGLISLKELLINSNLVVDIRPLSSLDSLRLLNLNDNQIDDFRFLLTFMPYINNEVEMVVIGNPDEILNKIVKKGHAALKAYYDEQDREGIILTDRLKVIVIGNSTAGKTSLVKYWGNKTFDEQQVSTHGIYTPMDIPLEDDYVRVNVWDFGGQDYYHATHRLFITRDSTFVLVCARELENKPEEELTKEYVLENGVVTEKEVRVQHYPYTYWLQTLSHLIGADKNENKMPLFLVENKCGLYADNARMHLTESDRKKILFEIVGNDFFHLDIQDAWIFSEKPMENLHLAVHASEYQKFEKGLLSILQKQVKENRHEIIRYFPNVRDTLETLAELRKNEQVSDALNELLAENKIDRIERYKKLPIWISYKEYQDIVYRARTKKEGEPPWESLHIYLQNMCGRIFHFKDIPALKDIVFIDPNWLHQTIYKVLGSEVRDNKGEFTLEQADAVIDGDILDAATFLEAMKAFELVFEIPNQTPRKFIAPQYLPLDCPLSPGQMKKNKEHHHEQSLVLEFPHYLPPSLISRLISLKGHLIKDLDEPLWRNGVFYVEYGVSTFILCEPKGKRIEIYLGKGKPVADKQKALRGFMEFMEKHFSEDIYEMLVSLPGSTGKVKWKHLYASKKSGRYGAKDYSSPDEGTMTDTAPFAFLVQDFVRKPIRVFVCYSHENSDAMKVFTKELQKQLQTFSVQHKIDILPFSDLELTTGIEWDTVLQNEITKADVLICLLSSGFFSSAYIQNKEYGRVFKELKEGHRDTLIAPVYFEACYIADINEIRDIQFYMPPAKSFGLTDSKDFSFTNLLAQNKYDMVSNYVKGLIEELSSELKRIWEVR